MNSLSTPYFQFKQRLGMHYFPDTLHYRDQDFSTWIPALKSLHISWLVLQAPVDRAIPEAFIKGLLEQKITPVLHFDSIPEELNEASELDPLLQAYAHWGVNHVILFNQPNMRASWSVAKWTQKNLVDQFLERFLPAASLAVQYGIRPVLPPLFPGGDYWDTIFLRSALTRILEKTDRLIHHLQLSSYAWTWDKPLNWGAGGMERWPTAHPYSQTEEPDQRGFRNHEWYSQVAESVLGQRLPMHLLGAGLRSAPEQAPQAGKDVAENEDMVLKTARLAAGEEVADTNGSPAHLEPLSGQVASVNFWLLSAAPDHPAFAQAWLEDPETPREVAIRFKEWAASSYEKDEKLWRDKKRLMNLHSVQAAPMSPTYPANLPARQGVEELDRAVKMPLPKNAPSTEAPAGRPAVAEKAVPAAPLTPAAAAPAPAVRKNGLIKPIEHYLLLPRYEWGISDWHLDVIRPFIKRHQVTVGFSIKEAALAKRVTVVGNRQSFSDELLDKLRSIGCEVERIQGDGTSIASQLATR